MAAEGRTRGGREKAPLLQRLRALRSSTRWSPCGAGRPPRGPPQRLPGGNQRTRRGGAWGRGSGETWQCEGHGQTCPPQTPFPAQMTATLFPGAAQKGSPSAAQPPDSKGRPQGAQHRDALSSRAEGKGRASRARRGYSDVQGKTPDPRPRGRNPRDAPGARGASLAPPRAETRAQGRRAAPAPKGLPRRVLPAQMVPSMRVSAATSTANLSLCSPV